MKFSIIIPVYNVAPYLRECLSSVVKATEQVKIEGEQGNVEIICVDDGSTDGSAEILKEFSLRCSPSTFAFRIIHQPNRGVSAARNAALDVATGEWVGFVDGDDAVDSDWLTTALQVIEATDADIVRMRCRGASVRTRAADSSYRVFEGEEATSWGLSAYFDQGWSVLNFVRRDRAARFPEGMRLCEDNIFFLKTLKGVRKAVQCEFDGYFYRTREGAATQRPFPVKDCVRVFDEVKGLPCGRTAAFVRRSSRFLSNVLEWWSRCRIAGEDFSGLRAAVRGARACGLLSLGALPFKAKLQVAPFVFAGSLAGYRCASFVSRVKGVFR